MHTHMDYYSLARVVSILAWENGVVFFSVSAPRVIPHENLPEKIDYHEDLFPDENHSAV